VTERATYQLTDPAALEALAHPLRNRLLGLLRTDGPATASGLAQRVGESSGVTSYHLRKLAEVGFVEEETERGTKRERWWRSVHTATTWSPGLPRQPRGAPRIGQPAPGVVPLAAAAPRPLDGGGDRVGARVGGGRRLR